MEILTNILNPIDEETTEYLDNYVLRIEKGKIVEKKPLSKKMKKKEFKNLSKSILIPQLIDAHTHVPQIDMMGKYGKGLIGWLNEYTYPSEIEFGGTEECRKRSKKFFKKLKESGTGTAAIYSSIHFESTNIVFEEAEKARIRVYIGKTMMDQNCMKELKENKEQSISESIALSKKWNRKNEKINYIYSPRFAISTSFELMEEVGKLSRLHKTYIQTHLNETIEEKEYVKKIYPESKSYTEIYYNARILGPQTLLAHCIHNSKEELELISKTKSNIIHCPEANFFLKSGKFKLTEIQEYGIPIGLGSDVGAGTTLDMFEVMKSMIYMQKENIPISTPFYCSTLGNAKILGIDSFTGSIDVGKNAEFLKIDCLKDFKSGNDVLSFLIFSKEFKKSFLNM